MSTPMTLEEFTANFIVKVVDYKDLGENIVKVVFEVKCTVNKRVGVFIADVDTTNLNEGFTYEDVINAAWDLQKTNVNDWSIVNLPHEVLSAYTPLSVVDNSPITLTDFNNNFTVNVCRYELYPQISPSTWCVGLQIHKTDNPNVSMYIDGNVPIESQCNNVFCAAVVAAVWNIVKSNVCTWAAVELAKASVIDTTYTPTSF
jgi:hypothetical protein